MLGVVSQEINFSQFEKVLDIVVSWILRDTKKEALPKVVAILKRLSLGIKEIFKQELFQVDTKEG